MFEFEFSDRDRDVTEQQRIGVELSAEIKPEDLAKQLEERGLPPIVFGYDKPSIDLEPRRIEHNGSAEAPAED
jgi:hypothetical protein